MKIQNKVVVITGGDSGLGKALANALLKRRASIVLSGRTKDKSGKAAKLIGAVSYAADVRKETDVYGLAEFAKKKFGKIDIWINNAGISIPRSPIEKIDARKLHDVFEVNFFGTFYGSRIAAKIMKKQQKGVILNIGSAGSFFGRPLSAGYASSKWAVRGFTELLRLALKGTGISVFAVHPEGIKTNLFGSHRPREYDSFMEPEFVAEKIIKNLERRKPREEIVIRKP